MKPEPVCTEIPQLAVDHTNIVWIIYCIPYQRNGTFFEIFMIADLMSNYIFDIQIIDNPSDKITSIIMEDCIKTHDPPCFLWCNMENPYFLYPFDDLLHQYRIAKIYDFQIQYCQKAQHMLEEIETFIENQREDNLHEILIDFIEFHNNFEIDGYSPLCIYLNSINVPTSYNEVQFTFGNGSKSFSQFRTDHLMI